MASDSLFGGNDAADGGAFLLDSNDRALLDSMLADFAGGPAVAFDSGMLLTGSGSGGEKQGALTPGTGELEGPITNGDITMEVDIPAGTGLTFSGKDGQTPDAAEGYLNTAIGGYFSPNVDPNSDAGQQQQSLTGAVDDLLGSLGGGKDVSVRLVDFLGKTGTGAYVSPTDVTAQGVPTELTLDVGASPGRQVFGLNLGSLGGTKTVVLSHVEGVILGGEGTLRIGDNTSVRIESDNKAQKIIGGAGNDTLVGAGNDTLTGGAGSDVFCFGSNSKGHFTVTDFNATQDSIAVKIPGVWNFASLQAAVTKTTQTPTGVTYEVGPDLSVTLVGVSPGDITAGMIKFTF